MNWAAQRCSNARTAWVRTGRVLAAAMACWFAAFPVNAAESPVPAPPTSPSVPPAAAPVSPAAVPVAPAVDSGPLVAAATEEANRWLAELHAGKLEQTWLDCAAALQNAITEKEWIDSLIARNEKFGRLLMFRLHDANYTRTLPGAPLGEYVLARFLSKYENTPPLMETLVVAKDSLGDWRVAGYDVDSAEEKAPPR